MASSPALHPPSDGSAAPRALGAVERIRIVTILREHGVRHASLFGSFARGEQTADSDIDLLIDLPPGASLFDVSRLGLALEDALGRTVDLVTSFVNLHPVIRERVRREEDVLL